MDDVDVLMTSSLQNNQKLTYFITLKLTFCLPIYGNNLIYNRQSQEHHSPTINPIQIFSVFLGFAA